MEYERILALLRELARRKVDYILVGAVAVTILGIIRATEDIDFCLPRNEENLRCFEETLRAVRNDPEIDSIRPEDLAATTRMRIVPPGSVSASSGCAECGKTPTEVLLPGGPDVRRKAAGVSTGAHIYSVTQGRIT